MVPLSLIARRQNKTIDKDVVNDTENETKKFGLGKHVVIWD